jgi:hypothetical protein
MSADDTERRGKFAPGHDPRRGPGSRAPSKAVAELRTAFAEEGWTSLLLLVALRDDEKAPANVRLQAAIAILDRSPLGKPVQAIEDRTPLPPAAAVARIRSIVERLGVKIALEAEGSEAESADQAAHLGALVRRRNAAGVDAEADGEDGSDA